MNVKSVILLILLMTQVLTASAAQRDSKLITKFFKNMLASHAVADTGCAENQSPCGNWCCVHNQSCCFGVVCSAKGCPQADTTHPRKTQDRH